MNNKKKNGLIMWWTFFNDKYRKFCFKEINYKLINNKNKKSLKKYYHWEIWLLENLRMLSLEI